MADDPLNSSTPLPPLENDPAHWIPPLKTRSVGSLSPTNRSKAVDHFISDSEIHGQPSPSLVSDKYPALSLPRTDSNTELDSSRLLESDGLLDAQSEAQTATKLSPSSLIYQEEIERSLNSPSGGLPPFTSGKKQKSALVDLFALKSAPIGSRKLRRRKKHSAQSVIRQRMFGEPSSGTTNNSGIDATNTTNTTLKTNPSEVSDVERGMATKNVKDDVQDEKDESEENQTLYSAKSGNSSVSNSTRTRKYSLQGALKKLFGGRKAR
jgi:hypothetical protein